MIEVADLEIVQGAPARTLVQVDVLTFRPGQARVAWVGPDRRRKICSPRAVRPVVPSRVARSGGRLRRSDGG